MISVKSIFRKSASVSAESLWRREVRLMRERGASGGYHVGDARDTYGDEYQFVDQYRNIKFIKVKSGSSKAPLETRTRDYIYVTLGGKNQDTPKTVTYYDKKGKKRKQINISGNAHRIGDVVIPTPHTHLDYMHDGKTRSLSVREQKTLDTILRVWDIKKSKD